MPGYECFDVTIEAHVAHVVLSRGDQLNTMIPSFWRELPEIVQGISDDASARVVVISSTGKHFSAGMDLSAFSGGGLIAEAAGTASEIGRARANLRMGVLRLQESFNALERARVPVLAAVHGGCVGGAVDLVCAADCRYATRDAWFCVQETNIGIVADLGTLQRLPKIVPEGIARQVAYTGERLSAERAHHFGLVNEVYDSHEEMVEAVLGIAAQIARNSPLTVWGTKEMLNYARDHSVADGLDHIATWQAGMFQRADLEEAFRARAEGREPVYDDLGPLPRDT